jgi:molybdopterin converting factor small subunit
MAIVFLPPGLRQFSGGVEEVQLDAPHVQALLDALADRFPAMAEPLADMAVAVDGDIYTQPGYQPLRSDSEIHLLPRIAGG